MRRILFIALLFLTSCYPFGVIRTWSFSTRNYLSQAEEQELGGDLDGAIASYREHMDQRLKVKNRPDWENPYFYLLSIGDLQLRRDLIEDALASYVLAESKGVEKALVGDRYRQAARWYIEHNREEEALKLLQSHRDLDPLLFDTALDEFAKRLSAAELRNEQQRRQTDLTSKGSPR